MLGCNYTMAGMGHWFSGGGLLWLAVMIFIVATIITLVYRFFKSGPLLENSDKSDSLKILNARFARGEIDEQEYWKKKEILSS
ncbi:MAG: SHOCT domain-containing protein [Desulfobacteraceae bacterium]